MGILRTFAAAAFALAATFAPARAQQLTVWHDLGDNGVKWFEALSAEFAKTKPGVTVRSQSFPTDQWFGRVIGAINTNTAPDLIFNNYERVIRIQTQTNKVMDLKALTAGIADKSFLSEDDMRVATFGGKQIIIPIQRVQMAFGVRKSWLDKNGGKFPDTWDEVKTLAAAFRDKDPDGNGQADTFGMALQAAKPRDLIHMLDLFTFGSGLRHTLIDPEGKITIDQPAHAQVLEEFLKTYSTYKFVAPDTINHSFNEMYQVIEGGRGGMFRVGDWNVRKWDGANVLNGDFVSGPWPKFAADRPNAVVIGGMRGVAIPRTRPTRRWPRNSLPSCSRRRRSRPRSRMSALASARTSTSRSSRPARSISPRRSIASSPTTSRSRSTPSIRSSKPPSIASCSPASPTRRRTGRPSSPRPRRKCVSSQRS